MTEDLFSASEKAHGSPPLVSVILPVFNAERFVVQAIQSALRQTYRNIEVIVVDDGSTDRTPSALAAEAALDSRVRIIHQKNCGVAAARNRAMAEARGEFIAPLDADDLWDPRKLERQVARMIEAGEETGLVYCWWVWIDEQGKVLDRSPGWRIEGEALANLLQVNFTGNASVPLYRRRAIEEVGGYDESFELKRARGCEDWDLALRVAGRFRVACVPELLAGYRRVTGSMSTQSDVMWRSYRCVAESVGRREPPIAPEQCERSAAQFALYVAGVLFWAGSYVRAFGWALRAWRSPLLFQVLPYAWRVATRRLRAASHHAPATMAPGVPLDGGLVPEPLVPYDRIYAHLGPGWAAPGAAGRTATGRWFRSSLLQSVAAIGAVALAAVPHSGNDGLWFQGDSARHAANGFFWIDFLSALPASPMDFALSYYARYPVVNPVAYPPLFYVLEGIAFAAVAPSPFVARALILAFAMLAGLYTMAWARRWIGAGAGWAGAFLAILPGFVLWTNAVMLNVPATALGLACLYHFRRSFESGSRRHLTAGTAFAAAATLTYYLGGIVLCICLAWALAWWRDSRYPRRRLAWIVGAGAVLTIPAVIAAKAAPLFFLRNIPDAAVLVRSSTWTAYVRLLPEVTGWWVLALGCGGLAAAALDRRHRREALSIALWILVPLTVFSLLPARDARYILIVGPAFVLAAFLGLARLARFAGRRSGAWSAAGLTAALGAGLWSATAMPVPSISGFREVAEFLKQQAPAEPVLYDGYHDGPFGFYVRALDSGFDRRVLLAEQLLYRFGPTTGFAWVETSQVGSAEDVVRVIRSRSGCRWVAVEMGPRSQYATAQRLLRQAVRGAEFELVRCFPVRAAGAQCIDLYRVLAHVEPVSLVELHLSSYTNRAFGPISPIHR